MTTNTLMTRKSGKTGKVPNVLSRTSQVHNNQLIIDESASGPLICQIIEGVAMYLTTDGLPLVLGTRPLSL